MKKIMIKVLLFVVFMFAPMFLVIPNSVFADVNADTKNSIVSKAIFEGVYQCFGRFAYSSSWNASEGVHGLFRNSLEENTVKLPYSWTDVSDNGMNCKEIMIGSGTGIDNGGIKDSGLIPIDIQDSISAKEVADFFAGSAHNGVGGIGYKAESEGENGGGVSTVYELKYSVKNGSMCYTGLEGSFAVLPSGKAEIMYKGNKIDNLVFPKVTKTASGISSDSSSANVPAVGSGGTYEYSMCSNIIIDIGDISSGDEVAYSITISTPAGIESFVIYADGDGYNNFKELGIYQWPSDYGSSPIGFVPVQTEAQKDVSGFCDFCDYKMIYLNNPMNSVKGLNQKVRDNYKVRNLSSYGDLSLTEQEIYDLYKYYLRDVYKVPVVCEGENGYDFYDNSNSKEVNWKKGAKCRAYTSYSFISSTPSNLYGVGSGRHFDKKIENFDEVINELGKLNLDNINGADEGGTINGRPGGSEETEKNCYNAADNLGWLACTVLKIMTDAAEGAYNDYVEPALKVDPRLFSQEENEGTRFAWGTFQNIANVLFVILLLVVIFSQLTGVGIDNYGIKKILPKLIIAAILVNLSYWICMACIDLSNVVGNGLRNMFDGMNVNTVSEIVTNTGRMSLSDVNTSGLVSVSLLAALGGGVWAIAANPAILLTLLVSALGVVISIFFLFILLSMRQAALVVLVVISPLAFICYMLPNTKKLFDKYIKLAEALLLLYPIIGLLVGGGGYVSRLLLSSGFASQGLFSAFTSVIVGIVPIFFIPTLLKGSFAAMGNLGAKISGIGDRLRNGATRGIRNTNGYKNAQERGANRRDRLALSRRSGGYVGRDGKFHERDNLRTRFARSRVGRRLGADRAMGKARAQYIQNEIGRQDDIANLDNGGIANVALTKAASARDHKVIEGQVGVVRESQDIIRRNLENERMKAEVEVELGPKPRLNRDNLRTRTQNEINEAIADNNVDVLEVNTQLATQRRQSARDAQEYKAFQDQFAGLTPDQIRNEASGAGGWFNASNASSVQRMRALINHMNSNGMENDVFGMLEGVNVGDSAAVMSELANSNNKVMRAYGKSGGGESYTDFMDNGGMQRYAENKGSDLLSGMDDKALAQIRLHSGGSNQIMSTGLLMQAAANINSEDAVREINQMLSTRNDIDSVGITGEQLVRFNNSTITELASNPRATGAILRASDDIVTNNPRLASQMTGVNKVAVNGLRASRGDGGDTTSIV